MRNDIKVFKFLFRAALILHALSFFLFDSFVGPLTAFSLALAASFPRPVQKLADGAKKSADFILSRLGRAVAFIILTPFYFLLITPLGLLSRTTHKAKKGEPSASTLVPCEREIRPDFFRRQW
ncbi:MAG: hypothetical protein OXB88_11625 [Bacteriovoracales bacterium]|nr:hypothetical protein [Bacteriovoracales bacterium]